MKVAMHFLRTLLERSESYILQEICVKIALSLESQTITYQR